MPIYRWGTITLTNSHPCRSWTCPGCFQLSEINKLTRSLQCYFDFFFPLNGQQNRWVRQVSDCCWFCLHLSLKDPTTWIFVQNCEKWGWLLLCGKDLLVPVCIRPADVWLLFNSNSVNLCHFQKQNIIDKTTLRGFSHGHSKCPAFKGINDIHKAHLPYLAHRHCIF